jgi:sugar O-acyltransferase (sialic acid O-acetyltransferase NeuD family)
MKKPLLIYGAGGLGREILSWVKDMEEFRVEGFIDDTQPIGKKINGISVLGDVSFLLNTTDKLFVVLAFGSPQMKDRIALQLQSQLIEFPILIHPSVVLQDRERIQIGKGSVIAARSVLTTDIHIGDHVLVNLNCTIGHDCSIGDCTSIMPGSNIAGSVLIGPKVLVGSGSNIKNKVVVGEGSTVGMGSVVIGDVADNTTVAGVPAKKILK